MSRHDYTNSQLAAVLENTAWREVTRDEFFAEINRRNVGPFPVGKYPYTSEYRDLLDSYGTPGSTRGLSVGYYMPMSDTDPTPHIGRPAKRYFLPAK